jgi:hypothetical protein
LSLREAHKFSCVVKVRLFLNVARAINGAPASNHKAPRTARTADEKAKLNELKLALTIPPLRKRSGAR